jgi:ribosomal peptide maturation radical SAM protein 1
MAEFSPEILGRGDALIVVPPFAGLDRPSLAAHTLQACARESGFEVRVFYANFHLAAQIGDSCYEAICFAPTSALLGERFFARRAYGTPPLGRDHPLIEAAIEDISGQTNLTADAIRALEVTVHRWVEELATTLARSPFAAIGFSTTFEQTAASVALLNEMKRQAPEKIALLGGANCEGEMGEGLLSLACKVDYIFSGESERTFPQLLEAIRKGDKPSRQIITGEICRDLDSIPLTDFAEFFEQRDIFLAGSDYVSNDVAWLPYEASRGCWWGQKHHCTFCGINGQGMAFRQRSAGRVITDLRSLVSRHHLNRICMTDNIMPYSYFRSLIPVLGEEVPGLHMFYEQKANLSLDQVAALRDAGVAIIQPGIEALSTKLLQQMDKGVTARQNIALLRYARSVGVQLNWNLLYGFPEDHIDEYKSMLALVPLLTHLQPPSDLCRLSIDRFSPYHFAYQRYGIRSLTPMPSYMSVLPESADISKIAYHFVGDYYSGILADEELLGRLKAAIAIWKRCWEMDNTSPPSLAIISISPDQFMALDTRGLPGTQRVTFMNVPQARAALVGHPMDRDDGYGCEARDRLLAVEYEGWHIPLAVAAEEILAQFEKAGDLHVYNEKPEPAVKSLN